MCPKDDQLALFDPSQPFAIGSVCVRNRMVLAPMSGVTDLPFRQIAWRYGVGLVVTEMVASRELVHNRGESWERLRSTGIKPHMVQLAGREAHWMAEAARIVEGEGADIIDINMGCPAKKVTGGYSGSALMRDPDHALSLIEAVVKAVRVPVTVKMRLGWDSETINAPVIARRAEEAGVALITVHGRTRMQFYEGKADWEAIGAVRETINIPLIANGDVLSAADAQEIVRCSGADAVMIGRGAQGRPWYPGVMAGALEPSCMEKAKVACEHYSMMLDFYGREAGLRHARKHVAWYLEQNAPDTPAEMKANLMTEKDPQTVLRVLEEALLNGADNSQRVAA
ncbi:tRNA dihydrouridine synthase DusB [Rhizobium helianthi]|uniref:tRNA-dihydrouridine synthase n=1 Tax=Rhizobium helianthi TaxID=1132695 RepID=A0ABW4LZ27_9HYPH